ncbi:hypothetical protein QUC31_003466 [Theobroma cacao]
MLANLSIKHCFLKYSNFYVRLNGSSSFSETYGNPCLAFSEDFEVKEIENKFLNFTLVSQLWGFVYGSKYEEILALSRTETPGICRW